MEEPIQHQQYELAFHLLPSFSENDLEEKRREIEELIFKHGGLVSRYGEIKKMRLAYPIKKEKFSNFGYIEFFAPNDIVEKINKSLLLNENILRYLVIKREEEKVRPLRGISSSEAKPKMAKPKEPELEAKNTKELDKKIEEILEKL